MAQRTIHYLFGERISSQIEIADKERFLLGSILPDAIHACDRDRSHFKVKTDTLTYFDFEAFRDQFLDFMLQDDLYLGYYMHLVEDAFYRVFLYEDRMARPGTPEEVQRLHQDYHILNSYIVNKYNIHNILTRDISLAATPMGRIAAFHNREFLEALSHDFIEKTQGATAYLTEALLDEFVETYLPVAIQEIKSLREGVSALRAKAYAWPTKK